MFNSVPRLRHRKLISPLRHVAWTLRVSNVVQSLSDGAQYSKKNLERVEKSAILL